MADFDVINGVLQEHLQGLDEDILSYLVGAIESMSVSERKSNQALFDTISPFLMDAGVSEDEEQAMECRSLAVAFGGSGLKSAVNRDHQEDEDIPILLSAPVKMANNEYVNTKQAYLDASVFTPFDASINPLIDTEANRISNAVVAQDLDIKAIPTTQKEMRKQRKANEQLQRTLRQEALVRQLQEWQLFVPLEPKDVKLIQV